MRRTSLLIAAVVTTLVVGTGCGADATPNTPDEAAGGGTLVVGYDNEPVTLDPHLSVLNRTLLNLFFDSLVRQERDGEIVGALAESWKDNGDSIEFVLRDGVKFSDGTPVNADAVAFSLDRVLDPETASPKSSFLSSIDDVVVVDDSTVRLDLNRADPLLLTYLAHEHGAIVSPTAVEKYGDDFGRHPVGSGPWIFDSWTSGVELKIEKNPEYWGGQSGELPLLDGVRFRFITDPNVLKAELQTGGVDIVRLLPPTVVAELQSDPQLAFDDIGLRRSYYASFNVTGGPFADADLRAAAAHAINKESIASAAAGDLYELAPSFATANDWFYSDDLGQPSFDPTQAEASLAESSSSERDVEIVVRRRDPDPLIAELLQSQLNAVGFTARIEALEAAAYLERLKAHDFDIAIGVIDVPRLDPTLTFNPYFSSTGANNWSGLADEELDKLLTTAGQTTTQEERAAAYVEVQRHIVEQNYWSFLYQPVNLLVHAADVEDIDLDVDGEWRLERTHFADVE
ncbi:ABC transporter substrate-binding protein [Microbacterium esteraromaticum]|nr:ABC transporter substrate-binding protein [Microbacterium esteraromaticum]